VTELITESRWLLLAVPDDALGALSRELAQSGDWNGRTVLHCSGLHGPEILKSLAARGAETGLLHPLAVIPKNASRDLTKGSAARCEGSPTALRTALRLARKLELRPLSVDSWTPSKRADYHTAATLAANDIVALIVTASKLLQPLGLSRREALDALIPLAQGALGELNEEDPGEAVSGPIPRGDVGTVERHLARIRRRAPSLEQPHLALAAEQLKLAVEAGRIEPRQAAKLRKLFRGGR
jgi:predicted short-subunit dehydrogenase-like oxidoreductase (DUF2520 family)